MSRHEDVLRNVDEEFRFLERLDRELLSHRGDDLSKVFCRDPEAEQIRQLCQGCFCFLRREVRDGPCLLKGSCSSCRSGSLAGIFGIRECR